MMTVRAGVASETGNVRVRNEDSALAGRGVFAVADGMGGHAAGDVASRLAIAISANRVLVQAGLAALAVNVISDWVLSRWLGVSGVALSAAPTAGEATSPIAQAPSTPGMRR